MATVIEECTNEEQRSVARFLWTKGRNAKDIHKEMFPVYSGGSVYRGKLFTTGSKNYHLGGKRFAHDEEVETEVRK
jgi:hypothetical protein